MKRLLLSALGALSLASLGSAADPRAGNEMLAAALAKLDRHDPQSPSFDPSLTEGDYLDDEREFLILANENWVDSASRAYIDLAVRRAEAGLIQCFFVTDRFRKLQADGKATDADVQKERRNIQAAAISMLAKSERSHRLANAERHAKRAEMELKSAVNIYNARKRKAGFAAEQEAERLANLPWAPYVGWPTYWPNYMVGGTYGFGYGLYDDYGGSSPFGYAAGGYYGYGSYPWSTFTYGGMTDWGGYSPYSFGGFSYGFGYGWGGGY